MPHKRTSTLDDDSQQLLAKHMCHSSEVQQRYYQATHTTERAIRAHSIIAATIQGNEFEIGNSAGTIVLCFFCRQG